MRKQRASDEGSCHTCSDSYNRGFRSIYSPLEALFTTSNALSHLGVRLRQVQGLSRSLMRDSFLLASTIDTCAVLLAQPAATPYFPPPARLDRLESLTAEMRNLAYAHSVVLGAISSVREDLVLVKECGWVFDGEDMGKIEIDIDEGLAALDSENGLGCELLEGLTLDLAPARSALLNILEAVGRLGGGKAVEWLETAPPMESGEESVWGRGEEAIMEMSWRRGDAYVKEIQSMGFW